MATTSNRTKLMTIVLESEGNSYHIETEFHGTQNPDMARRTLARAAAGIIQTVRKLCRSRDEFNELIETTFPES